MGKKYSSQKMLVSHMLPVRMRDFELEFHAYMQSTPARHDVATLYMLGNDLLHSETDEGYAERERRDQLTILYEPSGGYVTGYLWALQEF